jgi:nucleoside-specific outer membrane channel protein Tsx
MGNEGLRLTPEEIKTCEDAANQGDAAAAQKLWHHYEFVAYDHEKGEMWRDKYERLSKGETKK